MSVNSVGEALQIQDRKSLFTFKYHHLKACLKGMGLLPGHKYFLCQGCQDGQPPLPAATWQYPLTR